MQAIERFQPGKLEAVTLFLVLAICVAITIHLPNSESSPSLSLTVVFSTIGGVWLYIVARRHIRRYGELSRTEARFYDRVEGRSRWVWASCTDLRFTCGPLILHEVESQREDIPEGSPPQWALPQEAARLPEKIADPGNAVHFLQTASTEPGAAARESLGIMTVQIFRTLIIDRVESMPHCRDRHLAIACRVAEPLRVEVIGRHSDPVGMHMASFAMCVFAEPGCVLYMANAERVDRVEISL